MSDACEPYTVRDEAIALSIGREYESKVLEKGNSYNPLLIVDRAKWDKYCSTNKRTNTVT